MEVEGGGAYAEFPRVGKVECSVLSWNWGFGNK